MQQNSYANQNGFSLIELLIVVLVISILIAIALPIYNQVQQTARDRVDEANIKILNSATLQWILLDDEHNSKDEDTASLKEKLAGEYVQEWPISPNGYNYVLEDGSWMIESGEK